MTQTTVALNNQWLDSSVAFSVSACQSANPINGTATQNAGQWANANVSYVATWPQYQPGIWWYPYEGPSRPIKLALSEIARLKAAAKRDAKLKAILALSRLLL